MADRNNMNGIPNPWAQMMEAAAANLHQHPFFAAFNPEARDRGNDDARAPPPDYEDPPASVPDGDAPPPPPPPPGHGPPPHHRGHHGPHHGPRHGPHHGPHHGPPPHGADPFHGHGFGFGGPHPYASFGEPFEQGFSGPFYGGPFSAGPSAGGPCGGRGGFGGRGGHGGPFRGSRGGWGGRGRGHCRGRSGSNSDNNTGDNSFAKWQEMMKDIDADKIGEFFAEMAGQFFPDGPYNKERSGPVPEGKDFQPAADIFDTEEAYVVHLSLPGAKKEDVGVNWDADKFELSVAGVVYRPGNEEMLKTLSLDERQVGAFERKIALGTKENPVHIDAEGISAKMEDGVLMITAPKMEQDFVEVKKVQIE